ncbi:hypothetical protein OF83DRAFT_1252292 [Amylostereum chailletii]|nr:hypothetical protein OF83DRAFT_1252292 [Amylostereum chailletii]
MDTQFGEDGPETVTSILEDSATLGVNARKAVDIVDKTWYHEIAKRGRWMDLIGDYAGSERFIVDGESLLQVVLDDPLLALGQDEDTSFQGLHAIHIMEQLLHDLIKRSAVFDIVFFGVSRHLALKESGSDFVAASRGLARALLFAHLVNEANVIGVSVHTFSGLSDEAWKTYRRKTRPMFIMINDGGALTNEPLQPECVLLQRMFIIRLLFDGVAVSLLRDAEFRDSKIFSFVFEQKYDPNAAMPTRLSSAHEDALQTLTVKYANRRQRLGEGQLLVGPTVGGQSLDSVLQHFVKTIRLIPVAQAQSTNPLFFTLLHLFVTHCLLLPTLSVTQRARRLDALNSNLKDEILHTFLPAAYLALESVVLKTNTVVDCDGRLFSALTYFVIANPSIAVKEVVSPEIFNRATTICKAIGTEPDYKALVTLYPNPTDTTKRVSRQRPSALTLVPFHNPVFDTELASVYIPVAADSEDIATDLEFSQGTAFRDINHWHAHKRTILPKHLGGQEPKPATEKDRRKKLRSEQRFMSSMQQLAATLTGASGGSLKQIVITTVGDKPRPSKLRPPPPAQKIPQKKGKPAKLSSADKIRQQKAGADRAKEDAVSAEWWSQQQAGLAKLTGIPAKLEALRRLCRNPRTEHGWLAVEVPLYRMNLEIMQWIADPAQETDAVRDIYSVSLLRQVKEVYAKPGLTPAVVAALESILTSIGFAEYIPTLTASTTVSEDARPLSFEFTKLLKSKSKRPVHKFMCITEDPIVWQLRVFGEYMDRSTDSQPDPRVAFNPDAWQREVLDCLDQKDCSVLVVAPTSAGKTFISFYAMERVLRDSDDGILVYVAPTKALVNQVAAEVYARFSKDLNGRTCWAIHTRDYRIHDPQKCQILVTVPEMLAIMLLSPPLARTWTPRIKRIILDEIHTIGQHEGGAVWEQILLLAPCPIIGLSATVGEPEAFNSWLQSVQEAKGYGHRFIHHPHRYSHLRKFAYFPQLLTGKGGLVSNDKTLPIAKPAQFRGLDQVKSTGVMRFLHPVASLGFGATAIPSDLSLEASDVLDVYTALSALGQDTVDMDHSQLNPVKFFSSTELIRQQDVLAYEAAIKNVLAPMITTSDVLDDSSPLQRIVARLNDPVLAQANMDVLNTPPTRDVFTSGLIHLLSDLHVEGDLPALLFNFDRNHCEVMATRLCEHLESTEAEWRENSPEWQRKLAQWELWKSRDKERERRAEREKKTKKDPDGDNNPRQTDDRSWESSFDPDEPAPQFSFAGRYTAFSKVDLEEEIRALRWRSSIPEWAYRALQRGIGVHHSGMNKGYRSLVERLFRVRFLRVVIATGTLALGINAPTKTSVFCGDSPFLTALTYRQCAGRAGRRGYDTLGRVVFYGIPLDRLHRVILSKLPRLTGTFPLSSTLSLRLFNLLHGSENAPYAKDAVQSILRLPQISFGSDVGREQLLHHLRFSIEYLRRARLLDKDGRPINLFGVASHLYYNEPSNLALVALLQSGVVHDICSKGSLLQAQRELMTLMSHLFGRRYLPEAYSTKENLKEIFKKSPSIVKLPDMTKHARGVLVKHQREILEVFTAYALAYASQYEGQLGRDVRLPLSHKVYDGLPEDQQNTTFHRYLSATALQPVARSLFVANSGHDDHFASISELARTSRRGLHLNEHAIPTMERITDPPRALNAYLLDFYMHGQVAALAQANGVRRGDVWFVLQDFDLTLKTVRGDLENMLLRAGKDAEKGADEDGETVDSGYQTFDHAESEGFEEVEESAMGVTTRTRPKGVSDKDWRVLEVMDGIVNDFGEKFRAMWA